MYTYNITVYEILFQRRITNTLTRNWPKYAQQERILRSLQVYTQSLTQESTTQLSLWRVLKTAAALSSLANYTPTSTHWR